MGNPRRPTPPEPTAYMKERSRLLADLAERSKAGDEDAAKMLLDATRPVLVAAPRSRSRPYNWRSYQSGDDDFLGTAATFGFGAALY